MSYAVNRVVDGDTVRIDYQGEDVSVRLIGVDTPETVHPRRPVEPFGPEATQFLIALLARERGYLEVMYSASSLSSRTPHSHSLE